MNCKECDKEIRVSFNLGKDKYCGKCYYKKSKGVNIMYVVKLNNKTSRTFKKASNAIALATRLEKLLPNVKVEVDKKVNLYISNIDYVCIANVVFPEVITIPYSKINDKEYIMEELENQAQIDYNDYAYAEISNVEYYLI